MTINKDYIEYHKELVDLGFIDLSIKNLNKIANSGYEDVNIKQDLISIMHYKTVMEEFSKMYGECFSKVNDIVYRYLTAVYTGLNEDDNTPEEELKLLYTVYNGIIKGLGDLDSAEIFLISSDDKYMIDVVPQYKDIESKYPSLEDFYSSINYITTNGIYSDEYKFTNINSDGFMKGNYGQFVREYLQDEIIKILDCMNKKLYTAYNKSVLGSIEILKKYNSAYRLKRITNSDHLS